MEEFSQRDDDCLSEYRQEISPFLADSLSGLQDSNGLYFMTAPGIGDRPSQVWFHRDSESHEFTKILEFPDSRDYDPETPSMAYDFEPLTRQQGYWSDAYQDEVHDLTRRSLMESARIMRSVKVTSSKQTHVSIEISAEEISGQILLNFSDDGSGIPEEIREKAFGRFVTTARDRGGTGVGLYLVKRLVEENLRGSISFENRRLSGRGYTIEFPQTHPDRLKSREESSRD